MSTRSPMNKRTQEQLREGKNGMARKSAASAKPARAAASSVRVVPASSKAKRQQAEIGEDLSNLSREEKRARKAEIRRQEDRVYEGANILLKDDYQYHRYRKIWYVFMGVGVAMIIAAFVMIAFLGESSNSTARMVQYGVVIMAYVAIIAGLVFDAVKIRPIRDEARAKCAGMSAGRLNSLLENGASEEDKRRAEKQSKKGSKRKKK